MSTPKQSATLAVTDAEFKVFYDNQVTKANTADEAKKEVYIAHVTEKIVEETDATRKI